MDDPLKVSNDIGIVSRVDVGADNNPTFGWDVPYREDPDYRLDGTREKIRFMVSLPGGMEELSVLEVKNQFSGPIKLRAGKLHLETTIDRLQDLHTLRSIDKINLCIADIPMDWESYENMDDMLPVLEKAAFSIDWKLVEEIWSKNQGYIRLRATNVNRKGQKTVYADVDTDEDVAQRKANPDFAMSSFGIPIRDQNCTIDASNILFRCSANRIGKKQIMTSDKLAFHFGGFIQDATNWKVNLSNYNCEIICYMMGDTFQVNLSLCNESLHKRNIIHYGITTLRATICHGLLREAKIEVGDIVLDPMVGCGSVPIEGSISCGPRAYFIASDLYGAAVRRAEVNVVGLNELAVSHNKSPLMVDCTQMDCTNLPFRDLTIDTVASDLPFGKRFNEKMLGVSNRVLYSEALSELGRVCRKWGVFLTSDRRSIQIALENLPNVWKLISIRMINQGGLRVGIHLLQKVDYFDQLKAEKKQVKILEKLNVVDK